MTKSAVHAVLAPVLIGLLLSGCGSKDADLTDTPDSADTGGPLTDVDADGYSASEDCDDTNAVVNPGAVELCDGIDNNCDGQIDEGVTTAYYLDTDGDGFGDPGTPLDTCETPEGYSAVSTDCDDSRAEVHPGAAEQCDDLDNDCDGDIDEEVLEDWYADADGDGFGDPDAVAGTCDPPAGYVADSTDCDDAEPSAYPGGKETCDELDNDCNGEIDEDVTTTFYQDADGDSYGVADQTTAACALPTGYADAAGDCDDDDGAINPDAEEICDGLDNDCDGDTDSNAVDMSTYYIDSDGDGFGGTTTTTACDLPSGYADNSDDCDDGEAASNPDEVEICDGLDNDCSGDIDSDAVDVTTYYIDSDGDGFGGTTTTTACDLPSGYTDNSDDCDDGEAASNPDEVEICDGLDNDCSGSIDDNASDASTFYADGDGDGFGDPSTTTSECDVPSGYTSDKTDCDDAEFSINPDADEYCNSKDDDCDGTIDNDALDASTWYADDDMDGYGDASSTLDECLRPSGYVANDDDCDDTDPDDTDGDGLQDCEDDDIDGDGLRNAWDGDPYDDSIARGPTGGLGGDGDLSLTSSETQGDQTLLDGSASAGDTTIDVLDSAALTEGDEILVLSQQGDDAGSWQLVFVSSVAGDTLTIEPPLADDYASDSVVLVQRVPHYGDADIAAGVTLAASDWEGAGGGVLIFRAEGDVTVAGALDASGTGYRGGDGVYGNDSSGDQGESYGEEGREGDSSANGGGGGSFLLRADNGDSGGGGGYGSAGDGGTNEDGYTITAGGSQYGDADLSDWYTGSGGGGGSPDDESDGDSSSNYAGNGGDGGGLIAIFSASSITISGTATADGSDGDDASSDGGEIGGGGAGSGGQILLAAPTLTLSGQVTAAGGSGGSSAWHNGQPYGSAYGGDGGDGRIRLDYDSLSGSTSPSAGSTNGYED